MINDTMEPGKALRRARKQLGLMQPGAMPRHGEQFAKANGLAPAQTSKRLATLVKVLPVAARQVLVQSKPHRFEQCPILDRLLDTIEQRCTTTLRRLAA